MTNSIEKAEGKHLDRRQFLKWTGVSAGALAAGSLWTPALPFFGANASAATATAPWNHNPASPIGPNHWADIGYPLCGSGLSRSPVNIPTRAVRVRSGSLLLHYEDTELEIENTGRYVEVPIPPGVTDTLQIGSDRYELVQYHFHAPSEHTINGRHPDLEAHFVHKSVAGDTAVVGVFFDVGPRSNRLLDTILLSAPTTAGRHVTVGEANPIGLLRGVPGVTTSRDGRPARVDLFYAYDGSLTTPGCAGDLRWTVVANGGRVSGPAVARFHRLIGHFPTTPAIPTTTGLCRRLTGGSSSSTSAAGWIDRDAPVPGDLAVIAGGDDHLVGRPTARSDDLSTATAHGPVDKSSALSVVLRRG